VIEAGDEVAVHFAHSETWACHRLVDGRDEFDLLDSGSEGVRGGGERPEHVDDHDIAGRGPGALDSGDGPDPHRPNISSTLGGRISFARLNMVKSRVTIFCTGA